MKTINSFKKHNILSVCIDIVFYVTTISLAAVIVTPTTASASENASKEIQTLYVSYLKHDNSNSVSWTNSSLNHLTGMLKCIVDNHNHSAKFSVHNLKQIDGDLSGLTQKVKRLSQDEQKTVSVVVQQSLPQVNSLIYQVMQIDGTAVILKPILDSIASKLVRLTV